MLFMGSRGTDFYSLFERNAALPGLPRHLSSSGQIGWGGGASCWQWHHLPGAPWPGSQGARPEHAPCQSVFPSPGSQEPGALISGQSGAATQPGAEAGF